MIVLGYLLSFLYMGLVIAVGEGLQRKFNFNKEVTRKCEHIATAMSWVICYFFVGTTIHLFIINLLACVVLGVITFGNLMQSVDREDTEKSYGLFYFGLSTTVVAAIVVFVNPSFYPLHGIAWYCLAFGDGFAPIFARIFKKKNVQVIPPKTIMGMLGVFVFSILSVVVFNYAFSLNYSWAFVLSVGCLSTLLELFGKHGEDNFYVEFGVFGYLVMQYYGLVTTPLIVAIILSVPLVVFSAKSKALTHTANAVAFCFLLLCAFCGGWSLMAMVAVLFVLNGLSSKVAGHLHKKSPQTKKESNERSAWQILANSGVAAILAIAFYVTRERFFLFGAIAVIGEEFADSMASDFGRLSRRKPLDILRLKRMTTGLSGGVSLIGTAMALFGAVLAILVPYLVLGKALPLEIGGLLIGLAFVGTLIDSMLGSGLQALFKCEVCNSLIENPVHCQTDAVCVKGISWLDNSMVNFLSGLLTALLTCLSIALIF
ncbi:MAG: DUF92 domain-containing protein [Clostridia bacterium]|nr:DUF92 domain-containing protein [Clostridia bacterium]